MVQPQSKKAVRILQLGPLFEAGHTLGSFLLRFISLGKEKPCLGRKPTFILLSGCNKGLFRALQDWLAIGTFRGSFLCLLKIAKPEGVIRIRVFFFPGLEAPANSLLNISFPCQSQPEIVGQKAHGLCFTFGSRCEQPRPRLLIKLTGVLGVSTL